MAESKSIRKCYVATFTSDMSDIRCMFIIGAYSIKQARFLAYRSAEKINFKYNYKENNIGRCKLPTSAPKKGAFVMHEGKILII